MAELRESEINFHIKLDENNIPQEINWDASDGGEKGNCEAALLAIWDADENMALKIDLWTKKMLLDDMKRFFHQTFLTMADSFETATDEQEMAEEIRAFGDHFGEKMGILQKKKGK